MRTHTESRESGFTLIEILIVTTVFGVLAGVAVPNLLSSRLAANEAAVVATMRAVATAQFQFQSSSQLDTNFDSGYEYGTFGELAASDNLRGSDRPVQRNLLSAGLGKLDASGWVTHHGYHFCLYLPAVDGTGVVGVPGNEASMDPVLGHSFYTVLAWPVQLDVTGRRSFFLNQQGQLLQSLNARYDGSTSVPPAGAGLVGVAANNIATQALAVQAPGADGHDWVQMR